MTRKKAFTLVEVMIVVALVALIASIAFPNYLRSRIIANQGFARANLKSIGNALETYAVANGQYPLDTSSLLGTNIPYLTVDFFTGTHAGYVYSASLAPYIYTITAEPMNTSTGTITYTITTGAVLSP